MVLVRAYGLWALFLAVMLPGCASSPEVVPEELEPQVDKSLTFKQLSESPDSYRGRVVVVGGEVLKAKRLQDGTQIEVLELPLDDDHEPMSNRAESQGRFLALQLDFVDPATLAEGTRVTIVGEVSGAKTDRLDEVEYRFPTLTVKHLHVWPARSYESRRSGSWLGIFGGVGIGTGRSIGGVGIGTGF